MEIEFDPAKRDETLRLRGLDFGKAGQIFRGFHLSREDDRANYGEIRVVTLGRMGRTIVVCVWDGARRTTPDHLAPQGRTR